MQGLFRTICLRTCFGLFFGVLFFGALPALAYTQAVANTGVSYGIDNSKSTYGPGEPISIRWTASSTSGRKDWIGLYERGKNDFDFLTWQYIGVGSSGEVTFEDIPAGEYRARLFVNNSYTEVVATDQFTVQASDDDPADIPDEATYKLSLANDSFVVGDTITVLYEVNSSDSRTNDWIGLFTPSASNRQFKDFEYANSNRASVSFTLKEAGEFEFRYLKNNGYTDVASIGPITVMDRSDDTPPVTDTEIVVTDATITLGETIAFSWDGAETNYSPRDWIGLYAVGSKNRNFESWLYLDSASGNDTLTPKKTGEYELRFFRNDSFTVETISEVITVGAPEPTDPTDPTDPSPTTYTVTVSEDTFSVGDRVTVSWNTNDTTTAKDWIGLYQTTDSDRSYRAFVYTNEQNGSATFLLNQSGEFEIRYFKNNGYTKVAESNSFTVSANNQPTNPPTSAITIRSDANSYEVGETVTAIWNTPNGYQVFDWIGIYKLTSSNRGYLAFEYTDPLSNRETFRVFEPGQYEFRFFRKNNYELVARSAPFTVTHSDNALRCNGYDLSNVTNFPTGNGPIIALGDSITFGVGASAGQNYVAELERRQGVTIINAGVPADTTEDVLARLEEDVLDLNPSTVIVFIGGNDELRRIYDSLSDSATDRALEEELDDFVTNRLGLEWRDVPLIPRSETFSNIERIIREIQATGANVVLVGFDNTLFSDSIAEAYEAIAEDTGSIFIPDIYDNIFGRPSLMSDLIHPNNAGYDLIADRIEIGFECLVD